MAKVDRYAVINVTILGMARKTIKEANGASTPQEVYRHLLGHEAEIKAGYRAVKLSGSQVDKTWDNLLGRAQSDITNDDRSRGKVNDALSSGHRRTVFMRG